MMADDGRRSDATVPKPINNNYLKTLGLAGSDVTAMQVEIIILLVKSHLVVSACSVARPEAGTKRRNVLASWPHRATTNQQVCINCYIQCYDERGTYYVWGCDNLRSYLGEDNNNEYICNWQCKQSSNAPLLQYPAGVKAFMVPLISGFCTGCFKYVFVFSYMFVFCVYFSVFYTLGQS